MSDFLQFIHGLDVSIYYFLSRFAGNVVIDRIARLEEANNFLKGGILFAILWNYWFYGNAQKKEERRRAIVSILMGAILAIVVTRTVAFIVPFQVRPIYDPAIRHAMYAVHFQPSLENWSSFPSDTAAYFMALAFGIALLSRRIRIPMILYAAVWICLPRMYLGIHYASEILVGAAIGIASVWIVFKSRWVQSLVTQPVVAAMDRGLNWSYAIAFLLSFEMASLFAGTRGAADALLHGVEAGLHLRALGTVKSGPLEAWRGLLVMVAVVLFVIFSVLMLSHRRRSRRAVAPDATDQSVTRDRRQK
jgi:undecaprenyl-diphosphatase